MSIVLVLWNELSLMMSSFVSQVSASGGCSRGSNYTQWGVMQQMVSQGLLIKRRLLCHSASKDVYRIPFIDTWKVHLMKQTQKNDFSAINQRIWMWTKCLKILLSYWINSEHKLTRGPLSDHKLLLSWEFNQLYCSWSVIYERKG